jgi:2-iminobutanoate/2-iminopropanoate deaminase
LTYDPSIDLISPTAMHKPIGYSHVAKASGGKLLFIAGQVALDASGNVVGRGAMHAQVQQVFENLRAAVEGAGGSFQDVFKLNIYLIDIAQLAEYRNVRDLFIDINNPPVSTVVQVAALFRPEFMVEIEAVAILR